MRRSLGAGVAALLIALSLMPGFAIVFCVSTVSAKESATLASPEEAAKVNEALTLFIKRVNSSKPDVRHRAWTQMTANGQQVMFFPGDEQYFAPVKTKLLQSRDVTVNVSNGFDVDVILSGLWTPHGLWHGTISLTSEYLIDNFVMLDPAVPDGDSSVSLTVDLTDSSVTVDQPEFADVDVILFSIANKGTEFQRVEVDRLEDGQTIDDLAVQMANLTQDTYASTGMTPGQTQRIGLTRVKPGTYVISTINGGTATSPQTIIASATITITG